MSDVILVSVLGSGQMRASRNVMERNKLLKPKRLYTIEAYQPTGND